MKIIDKKHSFVSFSTNSFNLNDNNITPDSNKILAPFAGNQG